MKASQRSAGAGGSRRRSSARAAARVAGLAQRSGDTPAGMVLINEELIPESVWNETVAYYEAGACQCTRYACPQNIRPQEAAIRRATALRLTEEQLTMFLFGQLVVTAFETKNVRNRRDHAPSSPASGSGKGSQGTRQRAKVAPRMRYRNSFQYDAQRQVCLNMFVFFNGIKPKRFKVLVTHLHKHGATPLPVSKRKLAAGSAAEHAGVRGHHSGASAGSASTPKSTASRDGYSDAELADSTPRGSPSLSTPLSPPKSVTSTKRDGSSAGHRGAGTSPVESLSALASAAESVGASEPRSGAPSGTVKRASPRAEAEDSVNVRAAFTPRGGGSEAAGPTAAASRGDTTKMTKDPASVVALRDAVRAAAKRRRSGHATTAAHGPLDWDAASGRTGAPLFSAGAAREPGTSKPGPGAGAGAGARPVAAPLAGMAAMASSAQGATGDMPMAMPGHVGGSLYGGAAPAWMGYGRLPLAGAFAAAGHGADATGAGMRMAGMTAPMGSPLNAFRHGNEGAKGSLPTSGAAKRPRPGWYGGMQAGDPAAVAEQQRQQELMWAQARNAQLMYAMQAAQTFGTGGPWLPPPT